MRSLAILAAFAALSAVAVAAPSPSPSGMKGHMMGHSMMGHTPKPTPKPKMTAGHMMVHASPTP